MISLAKMFFVVPAIVAGIIIAAHWGHTPTDVRIGYGQCHALAAETEDYRASTFKDCQRIIDTLQGRAK